MSLHQLANHMSAQGRGPDSTLVHMSPREVSGLQSLAMAHGGTLTINPQTGLPEAGFLDSLMPTLLGGAATFFSGGAITPFMAALGVGGLTALTSKDLGKGLMAGLGAYGGSGIAGGLMNFGEAAIGAEAAKGALPSGIDPLSEQAASYEIGQAAANKAARAGATNFDRLSTGITEGFKNPMGAFSAIGGGSKLQGAAMIGAPLLSALSSQDQTSVPTPEQIKFDPSYANINITREQLPYQRDTGSSAQRGYFGPTYINRNAADGGFVSDGGIEHFGAGGRTRRDPVENMPYIRNGQSLTPADLVNLGNRGSKRFTPVIRPNQPEKPVVQQPIQPAPQQPIQPITQRPAEPIAPTQPTRPVEPTPQRPIEPTQPTQRPVNETGMVPKQVQPAPQQPIQPVTQQPMEPTRPVAQQPIEPPRPQQPMEPTQPTQRRIDETGMVPRQVVENPVIVPRLEGGRDSAARGGLMALAPGGYIDPDYDYSGYGRKKTDVVRPVTPMPDVPKPDFLAADGKTYRYDPIKRSWYVLKEAEDKKVNAGVETLMGGAGMGGNDGVTGQQGSGGQGQTGYGMLANLAGEAQRAGFTTIGSFLSSAIPENAAYNKTDLNTGLPTKGAFTAADLAALSGKNDKGSSVSLAADADARQAAKDNADNPTNPNPLGGDVTSSTPNGPSGAPPGGGDTPQGDIGGFDVGNAPSGDNANGGMVGRYAQGGLGSLGGYSDGGRLLRGPGDGVSDSIPATVGDRQPARLADGEFVVPARIVSELGNGSTEAGARALYKMMDRIQANRRKTTGKNNVAVNSKSHKYLPA